MAWRRIPLVLGGLFLALDASSSGIRDVPFGQVDGKEVRLYTIEGRGGLRASVTNYGATLVSVWAKDRTGQFEDVLAGFDTLEGYRSAANPYFGATVGRYANRIDRGRFTLDGKPYELATNNAPNHLHGGLRGFDKRVWEAKTETTALGPALRLSYTSPAGEEGYPGTLEVEVTYTVTDDDAVRIDYAYRALDEPTIANLTNHAYFNLAGEGQVLDHRLTLYSSHYTPVTASLIPTGELASVEGTPFDFRTPKPIGKDVLAEHPQIEFGKGYDHNFVVDGEAGVLRRAALVVEPKSGRAMTVWTTEPGVQLFAGDFGEPFTGKNGRAYKGRFAFCLETQHFPDSPNHPSFPTTVVLPGHTYRSTTLYRFFTE